MWLYNNIQHKLPRFGLVHSAPFSLLRCNQLYAKLSMVYTVHVVSNGLNNI